MPTPSAGAVSAATSAARSPEPLSRAPWEVPRSAPRAESPQAMRASTAAYEIVSPATGPQSLTTASAVRVRIASTTTTAPMTRPAIECP